MKLLQCQDARFVRPYGVQRRRHGVSLVEFALVVPVLLGLLMGILEFAVLARNNLMLSNAAREGARILALGGTTSVARTRMRSVANALNLPDSAISFTYTVDPVPATANGATVVPTAYAVGDGSTNNSAPVGSLIRVAINFPHKSLTNFFPILNGYHLKTNAAMRREG